MAASIKISELNSLNNLTDVDLFLVSDMETGTSRKISYTDLKSNIITGTESALLSLEGVVTQDRISITEKLEEAKDRIETLELDPVTKTYVDDKVASVIDFAPENLDTLNELAAALGDNPQTVSNLQAELTAYKAHMDDINLQLALAYDVPTYIDTLYGG